MFLGSEMDQLYISNLFNSFTPTSVNLVKFNFLLLKNSSVVSISFIGQNFFKHLVSTHKKHVC